MIIALLRFNCLTLPNCAGFDLKTLSKHEKAKKSAKGRKYYTAREASTAARSGELQFKPQSREHPLAREASRATRRCE